jgi:hypothetical protein
MPEIERLEQLLQNTINLHDREAMWKSVRSILAHGPKEQVSRSTGLALGYVQSGKTTSITALAAAAADDGYKVIVALLGTTNLLLEQNRIRLENALQITTRKDYKWTSIVNPGTTILGNRLVDYVKQDLVCLTPLLKNAGRIRSVAKQLQKLPEGTKVLIIDDEADQASLNTSRDAESKTYAAIKALRSAVPNHLYIQYTATPYAPLLLESVDALSPEFVEFLMPGKGYTGGKEFFIDNAHRVVRNIPMLDEQSTKNAPIDLPESLVKALASYFAGASLLLGNAQAQPPVSMLVHSTARNDVQAKYEHLIRRQKDKWQRSLDKNRFTSIPELILNERDRLIQNGAIDVTDQTFLSKLIYAMEKVSIWLVNSTAEVNRIDWHVSPVHILIGGNKLDRGFTVEGLTVTYMNRPRSPQIDTLEQRARAFGYRGDLLPYCQFFASIKTIRSLTEIVNTEEDLRMRLREHVEGGGSVQSWAEEIGLLIGKEMVPTRASVVHSLSDLALGWHQMRTPSTNSSDTEWNRKLLENIGLYAAPLNTYGSQEYRTLTITDENDIRDLIQNWRCAEFSPGWLQEEFAKAITRAFAYTKKVTIVLMENNGQPRVRRWRSDSNTVIDQLFQGENATEGSPNYYPGDRWILNIDQNPNQVILQVHRLVVKDHSNLGELLALALYIGTKTRKIVRKEFQIK